MAKHPFRVTLPLILVLITTVWNGLRLWTILAWYDLLSKFSSEPLLMISAVGGTFWVATGVTLLRSIWKNGTGSAKLVLKAVVGYTIWYWFERLILQNPHPNWPFTVIVNLIILLLTSFNTITSAREANENTHKNPATE